MSLAPIVLFAYNRPHHTSMAVNALIESELSQDSEIFVFIDGPKTKDDIEKIANIRSFIISKRKHFKKFECVTHSTNIGLYRNITEGVSSVLDKREKVIVIEDDVIVYRNFLRYMNNALQAYETHPRVWHINGYTEAIGELIERNNGSYFTRLMWCWGWGTWAEKWKKYEKDAGRLIGTLSKKDIKRFNMDGSLNLWAQVVDNKKGLQNSWAIFWYATIFQHNGLCLSPEMSYVKNIGFDGSGTHSTFQKSSQSRKLSDQNTHLDLPSVVEEDREVFLILKKYFRSTHTSRNKLRLRRLLSLGAEILRIIKRSRP